MAQLRRNGKRKTGFTKGVLPMPDGTIRVFTAFGPAALRIIIAEWRAECAELKLRKYKEIYGV